MNIAAHPSLDDATQVAPALAADPLILTLDVGTSSVRASLYDGRGRALQGMEVQLAHQMRSTQDGGVETDAGELFERVCAAIDGLLRAAGPLAARIAAVAPTTFWHNVLAAGADATPLTPLLTWADTRSAPAAADLRAALDPAAVHDRTGCVLHPSYLPAKIRWLQGGNADVRGLRHWLSFAEFLTLRLFGSPSCSISMASGSGLLDQHRCDWDREVLAAIPLDPALLSPLDDAPRRGLRRAYAGRWPALASVPWFPGWGDGATSNVGCGCVTAQRAAMMVGTSGAMRVVWRARDLRIPPNLWCYRIDRERVVVGGALSNGGNLLEWLRGTLDLPRAAATGSCSAGAAGAAAIAESSHTGQQAHDSPAALAEIEREIAALAPDAHGLTILPFLAGERSPGWAADARATISGLRLHSQPAEILRAGYESVAYRFDLVHDLLKEAIPGLVDPAAPPIVASGGALIHSPTWLGIMADTLQAPVAVSAVPEASSRGAALLALERLGAIATIDDLPAPVGATFLPDPGRGAIYQAAAERQRALYRLLIDGQHGG